MRRKPSRAARSSAASTRGWATPLNAVSAQPKPIPSHSMRATLAMLALASGSLVPRPTTTSSVSVRDRPPAPARRRYARRRLEQFGSMPRSRPSRTSIPGCCGREAVDLPGHVVLDVARGEQHAGHRQDSAERPAAQRRSSAVADRRAGEFEIAGREIVVRKPRGAAPPPPCSNSRDRLGIAAAVAAQQHRGSLIAVLLRRLIAACGAPRLAPR